ncbi:MAG: hypothetical protein ABI462_08910 [Ignavibacteria bacterium]
MKKFFILIFFFLFALNAFSFDPQKEGRFLNFSDVHFDPFYDTTLVIKLMRTDYKKWEKVFLTSPIKMLSRYGNDSNYPLFKSSLQDMKARIPYPEVIIITGDFMSHNFNENFEKYSGTNSTGERDNFIKKTIGFTQFMITKYFPSSQIFVTVGNDDADCGNYMVKPGGKFLREFSRLWSKHISIKDQSKSFNYTFKKDAYGMAGFRGSKDRKMIILNTIFFSAGYKNLCGDTLADPGSDELTWLRETLKNCRTQGFKTWLSFHIPPGIDIYNTIHGSGSCEEKVFTSWKEKYNDAFLRIVKDYKDVITGAFGGHYHRDDFRVIYDEKDPISFIHLTPSISPIYGNNPSYHIFKFDRSNHLLLNYETYYIKNLTGPDAAKWTFEYDFNKSFEQINITPASLNKVSSLILADTIYRSKYIMYYTAHNDKPYPGDYADWFYNWCGIGHLDREEYVNCLCSDSASVNH